VLVGDSGEEERITSSIVLCGKMHLTKQKAPSTGFDSRMKSLTALTVIKRPKTVSMRSKIWVQSTDILKSLRVEGGLAFRAFLSQAETPSIQNLHPLFKEFIESILLRTPNGGW
jgi:hypothetical protein